MKRHARLSFAIILGFLLQLAPASSFAGEFSAVIKNNRGIKAFSGGHAVEAYGDFTSALTDLPFSPEVHFNIATVFLQNKEFEKALSEYQQALKLNTGSSRRAQELRFLTYFNLGVVETQLKKIDEALSMYQKALDIKPDSLEAKTNIELLTAAGQGGGEGEQQKDDKHKDGKNDQDPKDKKDQDQKDKDKPSEKPKPSDLNSPPKEQKPQPKPFKSEELSNQDVGRILEELKRQEEGVRAKMNREGAKDAPVDKDW